MIVLRNVVECGTEKLCVQQHLNTKYTQALYTSAFLLQSYQYPQLGPLNISCIMQVIHTHTHTHTHTHMLCPAYIYIHIFINICKFTWMVLHYPYPLNLALSTSIFFFMIYLYRTSHLCQLQCRVLLDVCSILIMNTCWRKSSRRGWPASWTCEIRGSSPSPISVEYMFYPTLFPWFHF